MRLGYGKRNNDTGKVTEKSFEVSWWHVLGLVLLIYVFFRFVV